MSIIIFLIILLVLVFIHEAGHFIIAKWVGMRVDEFAFGFPPKIISKKIGETTYSLNSLPLGGYVSIYGESLSEENKGIDDKRKFGNRPWYSQIFVLVAGVVMNMILAYVLFVIISFGKTEVLVDDQAFANQIKINQRTIILDVNKNSPAFSAGLKSGFEIVGIKSGKAVADIKTATSTVAFIKSHISSPITITYKNIAGNTDKTTITGVYGILDGQKALGIGVERIGSVDIGLRQAFVLGYSRTIDVTKLTLSGLKELMVNLFKGKNVISSLSGPIGIEKMVGQAREFGLNALLSLTAILSINLAVFNMIPIPALDGGRIVIVLIEKISRRKIHFKSLMWANLVSFVLLILLTIAVTVKDIIN